MWTGFLRLKDLLSRLNLSLETFLEEKVENWSSGGRSPFGFAVVKKL